jgi:hypothetical protein
MWWQASATLIPAYCGMLASVTPSGFMWGPGANWRGGMVRAPAQLNPGTAGSYGRWASAASSDTDIRSLWPSHRRSRTVSGRSRTRRRRR